MCLVISINFQNAWGMQNEFQTLVTADERLLTEMFLNKQILKSMIPYKAYVGAINLVDSLPKKGDPVIEALLVKNNNCNDTDVTGIVVKCAIQGANNECCLHYYPVKFYEAHIEDRLSRSDQSGFDYADIIKKVKNENDIILNLRSYPHQYQPFFVKIVKDFTLQKEDNGNSYFTAVQIMGVIGLFMIVAITYYTV